MPEPSDRSEPAPEWFREPGMIFSGIRTGADMINESLQLWKGYHPDQEDILVEWIVRKGHMCGKLKVNELKPENLFLINNITIITLP